jgi:hypothetical protein
MLALAGINALAAVVFASLYTAGAAQVFSQAAFLASLVVFFVALTALWVRVERSRPGARDPISRLGRIAVGLLIAAIAVPGLGLMPLFSLQQQLPTEAGLGRVIPGIMVVLLASLVLVALVNVAGLALMVGSAIVGRLMERRR